MLGVTTPTNWGWIALPEGEVPVYPKRTGPKRKTAKRPAAAAYDMDLRCPEL